MIGIVTVLYNSEPVLKDFFESLNRQTYKDFALYIIDNLSYDNSLVEAQNLAKKVDFKSVILPQNDNKGVAEGNNIGIKAALADACDYVLLSNNDIVLEENAIEQLIRGLKENKATMAVPKIYYWNSDKIIWMAGGKYRWLRVRTRHIGEGEKDFGQYDNNVSVEYAPTCFMLIKSEVFMRIGYMDKDYFVYFDDTDFVWRAVICGKERLFFIYSSLIHHKVSFLTGGGNSAFTQKMMCRNVVYFSLKNYGLLHCLCVFAYLFFRLFLRDIWRLSFNNLILELNSYKEGCRLYYNNKRKKNWQ